MSTARIGISKLTVTVPDGRQTVAEVVSAWGGDPAEAKFLERIHELRNVPRLADEETLENLLCQTTSQMFAAGTDPKSIDFVLYAHSVLAQQPYGESLLSTVLDRVGLGGVPYWGVSQLNCASGLAGADLAVRMVKSRPNIKRVLLLTGDATAKIPEARYITKSTVMGDSASAALVEGDARYEFLSFAWTRDNRFPDGFYVTPEDQSKFGEIYQANLIEVARQACDKAGVPLEQVDWIVPHNVNMTTWRRFCRDTQFPKQRIFSSLLPDIGHSYCNDNFLNLQRMEAQGVLEGAQHLLFLCVGVGSYFGASVLKRHEAIKGD